MANTVNPACHYLDSWGFAGLQGKQLDEGDTALIWDTDDLQTYRFLITDRSQTHDWSPGPTASKGKRHPSIAGEVALGQWLNAAY